MKVLYISYDGMTDPLGQSQVLPYLKSLSENGYEFTLLSCEKEERFSLHEKKIKKLCTDSGINWHPIFYTKKPLVISTIGDVLKLRKVAKKLHLLNEFKIVHARSYIPSLIGQFLKRKFQVKFIFDMRGFWADERVEGNIWKKNNPFFYFIYRYFKQKERQFLEFADHIILLTMSAERQINLWCNNKKNLNTTVIPCCVDMELFDPKKINLDEQQRVREQLQIKNSDVILTYVGSLGTWYMMYEMLTFFKVQLAENIKSKFLIITKDDPSIVEHVRKELEIPDSRIVVSSADRENIRTFISLGSYSLYFIRPTFSKKGSSPTKMAEIMALGIPIITNSGIGDSDYLINELNTGIIVENFNEQSFEETLNQLAKTKFDSKSLRDIALNNFDLKIGVKRYKTAYDSVLSSQKDEG